MGFLDELGKDAASGAADKLDLVEYEKNLLAKFNDPENLGMKYKAESLGMTYDKKAKALDIYLYDGSETITLYEDFLREIQEMNKRVTGEENDVAVQSKYDRLQRYIAHALDQYEDLILKDIQQKIFPDWQGSHASLRACLHHYQAGEDAEALCGNIEQRMADMTGTTLGIEKVPFPVADRPIFSDEGMDRITAALTQGLQDVEEIRQRFLQRVADEESQNDIFGTLRPLVEGIAAQMQTFLTASAQGFEKFHNDMLEMDKSARAHSEEAARQAEKAARDALDHIQDLHVFEDEAAPAGSAGGMGTGSAPAAGGPGPEPSVSSSDPADAVQTAAPADAGQGSTAAPADAGQGSTAAPADASQSGTAAPADAGQNGTTAPADAGQSGTAAPADAGQNGTAAPAAAGQSSTAAPADAGQSSTAAPADAGQSGTAAPADASQNGTAATADAGQSGTAAPADAGQSSTAAPADASQSGTAAPADAGQGSTTAPADAGQSGTAAPADAGQGSTTAPADASQNGTAAPADAGQGSTAAPADASQNGTAAPADAGQSSTAASADASQGGTAAPADAGQGSTAAPADASQSSNAAPADASQSSTAAPADAGQGSTTAPADAGQSGTAAPADAGQSGTAAPADASQGSTAVPADAGQSGTAVPADASQNGTTAAPADAGPSGTTVPADAGQNGTAAPADAGQSSTAAPADAGQNGTTAPADASQNGTAAGAGSTPSSTTASAGTGPSGTAASAGSTPSGTTTAGTGNQGVNVGNVLRNAGTQLRNIGDILNRMGCSGGPANSGSGSGSGSGTGSGSGSGGGQIYDRPATNDMAQFIELAAEIIVEPVGANQLNQYADQNQRQNRRRQQYYLRVRMGEAPARANASSGTASTAVSRASSVNDYKPYRLTPYSIRRMKEYCIYIDPLVTASEAFYKQNFQRRSENFNRANAVTGALSKFVDRLGMGEVALASTFLDGGIPTSREEVKKWLARNVLLDTLAIGSLSHVGLAVHGGAVAVKALDWAMRYMKKSRVLTNLSEKFWEMQRDNMQLSPLQRYVDQYMRERYESENGFSRGRRAGFWNLHEARAVLSGEDEKHAFENAAFAAQQMITEYWSDEQDRTRFVQLESGMWLNLICAGLAAQKDKISARQAVRATGIIMNIWTLPDGQRPRLSVNPDNKKVMWD